MGWIRQAAGDELHYVEQLRGRFSGGGESIAKHGVAEWACGGDGLRAGGYEFLNAIVADALAFLFANERQAAAGSAAEAAFAIAWGFNKGAGLGNDGAGLVVDVAVAA